MFFERKHDTMAPDGSEVMGNDGPMIQKAR